MGWNCAHTETGAWNHSRFLLLGSSDRLRWWTLATLAGPSCYGNTGKWSNLETSKNRLPSFLMDIEPWKSGQMEGSSWESHPAKDAWGSCGKKRRAVSAEQVMVPKRWVRQVAKKDGRMAKHGLAISQKKTSFCRFRNWRSQCVLMGHSQRKWYPCDIPHFRKSHKLVDGIRCPNKHVFWKMLVLILVEVHQFPTMWCPIVS